MNHVLCIITTFAVIYASAIIPLTFILLFIILNNFLNMWIFLLLCWIRFFFHYHNLHITATLIWEYKKVYIFYFFEKNKHDFGLLHYRLQSSDTAKKKHNSYISIARENHINQFSLLLFWFSEAIIGLLIVTNSIINGQ